MQTLLAWRISIYMATLYLATSTAPPPLFIAEVCENGIDDDGDGLFDLNDPDCICPEVKPISLIPNPSFENKDCCPTSRSQLGCAKDWIQASEATTDYLHTCGWMGWENLPPPRPFPDGEAVVGFRNGRYGNESVPNWKEYAGACLTSPLKANTLYRFEFYIGFINQVHSPSFELVFYGSKDCKNLPFGVGDQNFGCPTNDPGWTRLKSTWVPRKDNGWVKTELQITPWQDIYAIAIGPNCTEEMHDESIYYFFDNLILADQKAFEFEISPKFHPCSQDFQLSVPAYDTIQYQWFKEGVALVGETYPQLNVKTGPGEYIVRLTGPSGCRITKPFRHRVPTVNTAIERHICPGSSYTLKDRLLEDPGYYIDTFKTTLNCDSIVNLQLFVESDQEYEVQAKIFPDEQFKVGSQNFSQEGNYRVPLQSFYGCDSIVLLNLSHYKVFIPNVFSPNGDGQNDHFSVQGGNDLSRISELQVFDRWGNMVYSGKDLTPNSYRNGWDGQLKGQPANSGLYLYLAKVLMDDGVERQLSGSVTLIR